jgi:hypothetical protein
MIPKIKSPNPTPTIAGNPLEAVAPPAINNPIPPTIHIRKKIPQMNVSVLEEDARLIFPIDC